MSNYPPPPPDPQHYNALYNASSGHQPMLDPMHQDLHYSAMSQQVHPLYPKLDTGASNEGSTAPPTMQSLAAGLHQQVNRDEIHRQQMHQVSPGQTNFTPISQPHTFAHATPTHTPHQTPDHGQKPNRLRKACDSCSIRKVKCDESGPPCRACAALDIPCTFERPTRRRGPPNRHAEAIKRRRVGDTFSGSPQGSDPASPPSAGQNVTTPSTTTSNQALTAESICSTDLISAFIDLFFTYVHPLSPFPHEPSFREAWKRREDINNKSFLALLSSVIGVSAAMVPRKARLHVKMLSGTQVFANMWTLIEKCRNVCALARGPSYLESHHLSIYDAITSYYLALMGACTYQSRQATIYLGESFTIFRALRLHDQKSLNQDVAEESQERQIDAITNDMNQRLFWSIFVSARAGQQLGSPLGELIIPPPTDSDPYPSLPSEVDDFCIYSDHVDPQPAGLLPMTFGFNTLSKVFSSYLAFSSLEMIWGSDELKSWEHQIRVLQQSLRKCKESVSNLPLELAMNPESEPFGTSSDSDVLSTVARFNASQSGSGGVLTQQQPEHGEPSPDDRRRTQHEVQKCNIYIDSLSTRLYIVEKYWKLSETRGNSKAHDPSLAADPVPEWSKGGVNGMGQNVPAESKLATNEDEIEREMHEEREGIVKDLLTVLGSITFADPELYSDGLILRLYQSDGTFNPLTITQVMKLQGITDVLSNAPAQRNGPVAAQVQGHLQTFRDLLYNLERAGAVKGDIDTESDEESELRHWADFRQHQNRFAQERDSIFGAL